MNEYTDEIRVAIAAVAEAAVVCQAVQSDIGTAALHKEDRSPVTVADFASQALVCRALAREFPDDPVIGEEDAVVLASDDGADFRARIHQRLQPFGAPTEAEILGYINRGGASSYSERFWTLDPIDGTKGFLRGEQYAVALALVVGGDVVVCALACPNLDNRPVDPKLPKGGIFWAAKGAGAHWAPLCHPGEARPLCVSRQGDVSQSRFCESVESAHSSHSHAAQVADRLGITAEPVRIDSQCKYAVVSRGDAEVYLRLPTRKDYQEKIWDHAAGCLLVEEAGGRVTDLTGAPLDFTHGRELVQNRGVIVTHGPFHDQILATLMDLGVE